MSLLSKPVVVGQSTYSQSITISVDGASVSAQAGQTIAAALMAAGWKSWRRSLYGHPRGVFCGIGVCYDCLVTVDGTSNVRACLTRVTDGMVVETGGEPGGQL
jgi:predicted molibdopterin-dependent oxidoreductase YjgC